MFQFRCIKISEEMFVSTEAMSLEHDRISDVEQERGFSYASLADQSHILPIAQQVETLSDIVSAPAKVFSTADGAAMEKRIAITTGHGTNSQEQQRQIESMPIIHLMA